MLFRSLPDCGGPRGLRTGDGAADPIGCAHAGHPHPQFRVESAVSDDAGSVTTLFNSAGQGIAQSLAQQPGIQSAKSKVSVIEKQQTLTFTVLAQAATELTEVRRLVEETERDFRAAFPDAAVRTVYNLHFDKVSK